MVSNAPLKVTFKQDKSRPSVLRATTLVPPPRNLSLSLLTPPLSVPDSPEKPILRTTRRARRIHLPSAARFPTMVSTWDLEPWPADQRVISVFGLKSHPKKRKIDVGLGWARTRYSERSCFVEYMCSLSRDNGGKKESQGVAAG